MSSLPHGPLTVIGLGANLGDDIAATIQAAMTDIAELSGVELVGRSSLWRTRPVGGPPQPDYCNAAVGVVSNLSPPELLVHLLAIEARFGRQRGEANAPRSLDLDILWIEGASIHTPGLTVPHPRLRERAFALIPLLEVVGDATDPASGELYAVVLAHLGTEGVRPYESP